MFLVKKSETFVSIMMNERDKWEKKKGKAKQGVGRIGLGWAGCFRA